MDLKTALHVSAAGMSAQSTRMRVIAENIANADSLSPTPGGQPYRRKLVTFRNQLDRTLGAQTVKVGAIVTDKSNLGRRYDPQNPAADTAGYVSTPNVNGLLEAIDLRQAQRSYEANLAVIDVSKSMLARTIQALR